MHRVYETTIIINAALDDNDVDVMISKVSNYIENHGGKIQEVNKWGRRRLAYAINKKFNGFYVHIIFDANSNIISILERFLVLEDTVLRHLTMKLEQKVRDFRAKRAVDMIEREKRMKEEDKFQKKRPPYVPKQEKAVDEKVISKGKDIEEKATTDDNTNKTDDKE